MSEWIGVAVIYVLLALALFLLTLERVASPDVRFGRLGHMGPTEDGGYEIRGLFAVPFLPLMVMLFAVAALVWAVDSLSVRKGPQP